MDKNQQDEHVMEIDSNLKTSETIQSEQNNDQKHPDQATIPVNFPLENNDPPNVIFNSTKSTFNPFAPSSLLTQPHRIQNEHPTAPIRFDPFGPPDTTNSFGEPDPDHMKQFDNSSFFNEKK